MRLKPKKSSQVISTSDRSPEVINVVDENVFFRVFFNVDVKVAIALSIVTCKFRIFENKESFKSKMKLAANESNLILNNPSIRKIKSQNFQDKIISKGTVDITKKIPNDGINNIKKGQGARKDKRIKLVDPNDKDSIDSPTVESSLDSDTTPNSKTVLSYRLDALYQKDVDPAGEVNKVSFHSKVRSNVDGLRTVGNLSRVDKKGQQFRKSISKKIEQVKRLKLEDIKSNIVQSHFDFKISKNDLKKYIFEVDAITKELSYLAPKTLQTVSFAVNLKEIYDDYSIPTQAPAVQIKSAQDSKFIKIKQKDKNATGVKIFRRLVSKSRSETTQFIHVASLDATQGQEINFVDKPENSGKFIYRIVSYNESQKTSGEFSSSVAPAAKSIEKKSHPDSLTILATENGPSIKVEIFNIPNDVVSVRLIRKNKTTKERLFSPPVTTKGGPLRSIDRKTSSVTFEDFPTRPDTIFEYKVVQTNLHGVSRESESSSIVRYVGDKTLQSGRVITSSEPKVTRGVSPKITFQVNAPTDEKSLNGIYDILKTSGLDTQYVDEIKSNRELFNKVVAFEMLRFDTVTGQNESFGVVNSGVFEDNEVTRRKANVSNLIPGRNYRYQYRLLLRSASTIFNDIIVNREDLETKREYSTNMKKFNSPKVLKRGVLSATSQLKQTNTKTGVVFDASTGSTYEMFEGATSLLGQTTATVPANNISIQNLTVKKAAKGNILRWKIVEGSQKIDHIVVEAEYNGIRAPIRSIHFDGRSNMLFVDNKLNVSLDDVKYYIYPIFTDLEQGDVIGPARSV